jgi:ABC-type lipoprotein export system ATPase subunit
MNEFSVTDFQKLAAVVNAMREQIDQLEHRLVAHTHDRLVADEMERAKAVEYTPTPAYYPKGI